MKMDMAGGACVLATVATAARLKLKVNILGLVPATDNKPAATAQCPGDVISTYNGKTVEVDNTDAEGRLILADALAYGIKRYKPHFTIDLATLTGACVIALGHVAAALYCTKSDEAKRLLDAGEKTGERCWQMPLYSEYNEQIKSAVADLKNTGGRAAGSITAAKFLEHFTGKTPWAHIDIAGTRYV